MITSRSTWTKGTHLLDTKLPTPETSQKDKQNRDSQTKESSILNF